MELAASGKLCVAVDSDAESMCDGSGSDSVCEEHDCNKVPILHVVGASLSAMLVLCALCAAFHNWPLHAKIGSAGSRLGHLKALSGAGASLSRTPSNEDAQILGAAVASSRSSSVQHWARDCWAACNGAGLCESWCGAGNSCCKFGASTDPVQCRGVKFWPSLTYHTCVQTQALPADAPSLRDVDLTRPPAKAMGYNGVAWPTMSFPGRDEMHIFAIGDWGGMDGGVITEVRPKKEYQRIIQYKGGDTPGPHVMARSRAGCHFTNLVECFNTKGQVGYNPSKSCLSSCGWTEGVDDQAQLLVAEQFKRRAAISDPQYILNVGDNFYWGGIEVDCGTPMGQISQVARQQFDDIFERIYTGPGLDGKPWLSVLGNHDWGGRYFNSGWDQQIAYTWASDRWVMPAAYFSQRMEYPDQGFSAEIFMIDSNVFDALDLDKNPEHNICGALHTPEEASCSAAGGPPSLAECKSWFERFWSRQQVWLEKRLQDSTADWQIVVTHFPCGHASGWYSKLHREFGLDLLVTGHRHEQELWANSARLGGLTCIVTGGGGGITSEVSPRGHATSSTQYGFFDMAISRRQIKVELINHEGMALKSSTVWPRAKR